MSEDTQLIAGHNVHDVMTLAREYLKDFNLPTAARRADLDYKQAWAIRKLAVFDQIVDELVQLTPTEELFPKNTIMLRLWEEANDFIDGNAATRVGAIKTMIEKLGYGAAEEHNLNIDTTPSINLTITRKEEPPMLEAEEVAEAEEDEGE